MKNHRIAPYFLPKRSTIAIALALSLGAMSAEVVALGFGEPEISSTLGQPLQMRVPLQPDPDVDLSPQCLRLLGSSRDTLPTLTTARLSIEESAKGKVLRIDSISAINEPILRVIVDAGCAQHVRREFTVLLDPPAAYTQTSALAPAVAATLSATGESNVAPPNSSIANEIGVALALDLGVARIQGRMGEPLFMQIPITGTAAATLDNASVREARILASDGTPLRGQAQISLTRSDTSTTLQLISAQAISEPALRVVVEVATPTASVRREYGVLLDLPAAAAAKASEDGAAATEPLAPAAEAPAPEAKPAPAASEALPPEAAPVAAPVKPRKHLTHRTPKSPAASKLAKAPAAVAPAELAHAPANTDARLEDKSAAKPSASVAPDKTGTGDHLVLSAPTTLGEAAAKRPAADQDEAAAKRFAEMDQRVKDLTEEIVRLRTELAAQKQHEAELIVQANRSGDNWLYAVLGAIGASAVALVLWTRRRNATPAWSPATWEQGNNQNPEGIESVVGPQDHELESLPGATVSRPGAAASAPLAAESAPKPAATLATQQPFRSARKSASTAVNSDPITISPLTTPIEVTEVLAHEPSIEQLYTLFYDIGGNTMPGATPRPGATPQPNTVLPPVALPKHDNLDIDLGIPESIQPVKASRTLGAMTPAALALGAAGAASASGTSFTYEEKPASAQGPSPVAGNLEPQTSFGPMTEIPRDMEFAKTQPGLDLDLTTNIGTASQLGPLTVIPADADAAKAPVASAPTHPAGLELDLSTNIGTSTEIGPLTVIPRDEEGPMTRVELDLDLNTNVQPLSANDDGMERESDPFAITTIPGNWAKSSG